MDFQLETPQLDELPIVASDSSGNLEIPQTTPGIPFFVAADIFDFITQLANRLAKLGAAECFLGHPMKNEMTFSNSFEGEFSVEEFDEQYYKGILELLDDDEMLHVRVPTDNDLQVSLERTSNGLHPTIHLVVSTQPMR